MNTLIKYHITSPNQPSINDNLSSKTQTQTKRSNLNNWKTDIIESFTENLMLKQEYHHFKQDP